MFFERDKVLLTNPFLIKKPKVEDLEIAANNRKVLL